jgi:putative transcriptional regulator
MRKYILATQMPNYRNEWKMERSSEWRNRREMTMPKKYRSKIMASIHEGVSDLYLVGGVDKKTMREFDALCLTPVLDMTPEKIRALRKRENTSQTVFAAYLNVTPSLVSKWERGEKHPQGASLKLLSLVEKKGLEIVA